ncbi:MAG TPA: hypothetical protein DD417_02655 [Elusimicrobia bacterium]|nr:hypothetical protein [Elusimicrobiota bacterium]
MGLCLLAGLPRPGDCKIGLSSQFAEVALEGLKPGRSYNLRELRGLPYTLKNRGDSPAMVQIDIVAPTDKELMKGYEKIPDLSWIEVRPARFRLDPQEAAFADIILKIPDDASLKDRHFMANLWGHTVDRGMLAAGVSSHLRFSIGKGPETLEAEKAAQEMVNLDYDLYPTVLHIKKARVGPYDLKAEEKKSYLLTNRHTELPTELVLSAIPWKTSIMPVPNGFDAPRDMDLSWVHFTPDRVKLDPMSLQEIKVTMDVPASLKGKQLVFLVQLALPIGTIVGATHAVHLTVLGDGTVQTAPAPVQIPAEVPKEQKKP